MPSEADREIARLRAHEEQAQALHALVEARVARSWRIAAVRWALAAALFAWFWDVEWVRWAALAALPALAWFVFSLRRLQRTVRERRESIERRNDVLLERTEREPVTNDPRELLARSLGRLVEAESETLESPIHLDAERLADRGIRRAYRMLGPALRRVGVDPWPLSEGGEAIVGTYSVRCGDRTYEIAGLHHASDGLDDDAAVRARATWALFDLVNRQLDGTGYRFFAVGAGPDLWGWLMSGEQARAAFDAAPEGSRERPYLPNEHPPGNESSH
ncbi:hypothetical protein Pla163_34250 [Planctomycetes bacterium Pla163]|uniref:Uncharacterized protein n=1 Tax=Rohdeia mirabilis TaxID=2528008 RepID=A0A518D472_9BACT|nr:hypothetical protein Pla163_34250 [Planctomycetes bacterium Pla163]